MPVLTVHCDEDGDVALPEWQGMTDPVPDGAGGWTRQVEVPDRLCESGAVSEARVRSVYRGIARWDLPGCVAGVQVAV